MGNIYADNYADNYTDISVENENGNAGNYVSLRNDYADNYADDFTENSGFSNWWVLDRLSTIKRSTDAWMQLAAALQLTVDRAIEPILTRLTSMRSLFTATDGDLETIENDLGEFFKVDRNLTGKDKAMAIITKQDSINYKSTLKPMIDMFNVKFQGLTVEWSPLYAHATLAENPYGSKLLTQEQITDFHLDINDYFLTSRGTVRIDILDVLAGGYTLTEFFTELSEGIEKLRPVHIVFDDAGLFLLYEIVDPANIFTLSVRELFREFPASVDVVGWDSSRATTRSFDGISAPVWNKEEYFRLDELPLDIWPMDTPLTMYGETYP